MYVDFPWTRNPLENSNEIPKQRAWSCSTIFSSVATELNDFFKMWWFCEAMPSLTLWASFDSWGSISSFEFLQFLTSYCKRNHCAPLSVFPAHLENDAFWHLPPLDLSGILHMLIYWPQCCSAPKTSHHDGPLLGFLCIPSSLHWLL